MLEPHFNGADLVESRDWSRLKSQFDRVKELMLDGQFRTLQEISDITGDPPASVSAQLRHAKKERFGSYVLEKEYIENGLYKYRLLPPLVNGQIKLF